MITRTLQLISSATLILSLLAGCATPINPLTPNPADTTRPGVTIDYEALKKVSIEFAVIKLTKNHPERGTKVHLIAVEVRKVAGTEDFNTVALLIDFIKTKANFDKLEPEDKILAEFFISEIERNLQDNFGFGIIPTDKLFQVTELANLVDQALGYPVAKSS